MKKVCLALCFSLFTSLIHAAVMPIGLSNHLPAKSTHHQIMVVDATAHHCHDEVSVEQDVHSQNICHGDSYQCCLGLVLVPSLGLKSSVISTKKSISIYAPLAPQLLSNSIFKPPKV